MNITPRTCSKMSSLWERLHKAPNGAGVRGFTLTFRRRGGSRMPVCDVRRDGAEDNRYVHQVIAHAPNATTSVLRTHATQPFSGCVGGNSWA